MTNVTMPCHHVVTDKSCPFNYICTFLLDVLLNIYLIAMVNASLRYMKVVCLHRRRPPSSVCWRSHRWM